MAFTGILKFFNSKFTLVKDRANFLSENAPLDLTSANLGELTSWLMVDVSTSDDACKTAWSGLYEMVKKSANEFVVLSANSVADKDAVADFLTETLRVCNFALHDANVISQFLTIITRCGITVVGDPDVCKHYATFAKLGYSSTTHQITMSST